MHKEGFCNVAYFCRLMGRYSFCIISVNFSLSSKDPPSNMILNPSSAEKNRQIAAFPICLPPRESKHIHLGKTFFSWSEDKYRDHCSLDLFLWMNGGAVLPIALIWLVARKKGWIWLPDGCYSKRQCCAVDKEMGPWLRNLRQMLRYRP